MNQRCLRMPTLLLVLVTSIAMKPQDSRIVRTVAPEEAERDFRHDQQQQKKWTESFYLDPMKVYLRAEEKARGVVLLPPQDPDHPEAKPPEVLDKVTQLCQAMRPATVAEKLEELYKLAISDDPILSHEAREAMQGLQRPPE